MPNRILKESICTSETIQKLSDFQETFFYRLIVNCDDYGRMDARPAILKARLYPLRERLTLREIQSALRALADAGCVEVYEIDGKPYLRLPSWEVHQQIRAKKSKFPAPDGTCKHLIADDSKCPRNPIQSESERESEYGKEKTPKGVQKKTLFHPPELSEVAAYCRERGNGVDAAKFHDFYASKGWMVGKNRMQDWKAAVRTWERDTGRRQAGWPVQSGNPFLDMLREEGEL